jgi:carbamate kinase
MRVVLALGGNALLRRGEPLTVDVQRGHLQGAADVIAAVSCEHDVVLTHGNGPQVGLLALQNAAFDEVAPYPLDVLDAESEGMVGYLLEQELGRRIPPGRLATLLTQIVVDADDPAFAHPTKFVGPAYDEAEARKLAEARGWTVARDGDRWRRVVPSPRPKRIVELRSIKLLVEDGVLVICAGGGGVPVVECPPMGVEGVEAVIDKDLSASLLARELGADALLLLTDVDAVYRNWGTPDAVRIRETTPTELRSLGAPDGSMGPKVEAVCEFIESGGRFAAIGSLMDAQAILEGRAGTILRATGEGRPSAPPPAPRGRPHGHGR